MLWSWRFSKNVIASSSKNLFKSSRKIWPNSQGHFQRYVAEKYSRISGCQRLKWSVQAFLSNAVKFVSGLRDSRLISLSRYFKWFYVVLVPKLPFLSPWNYSEEFNAFSWPGLSVFLNYSSFAVMLIPRLAFIRGCVWWRYPPLCRFIIPHSEEPRLNSIQSHHIY